MFKLMSDFSIKKAMNIHAVLFILFCIYVIAGLGGYGADDDTYGILSSGKSIWIRWAYGPSRFQGSLITEAIIGGLALLGGHYLTNMVSAILGVVTLFLLYKLAKPALEEKEIIALACIFGLNPHYVVSSSSAMDYIYSLFFLVYGIYIMERRLFYWGALLFALCVSARISNAFMIAVIYSYYFIYSVRAKDFNTTKIIIFSGLLCGLLITVNFIPVYISSGYTLSFLNYVAGDWDFINLASRWIYKNIYLLGLLPTILFISVLILRFKAKNSDLHKTSYGVALLIAIVIQEALFFKIPIHNEYLLPVLPVILFIWYAYTRQIRTLYILVFLTAISNIIEVEFLKMKYERNEDTPCDQGGNAIDAEFGIFPGYGYTLEKIMNIPRMQSMSIECRNIDEFFFY